MQRAEQGMRVSALALLQGLVLVAMASSAIVFSEPAPVDALMLALMLAMPVLAIGKVGPVTRAALACWLLIVASGLIACAFSPGIGNAMKHQLVTLFLVLGAAALASFVAVSPERHTTIVLGGYLLGCLLATTVAVIGYFRLAPGAFELFTSYGRARGTFKDPNVYGAALVPAIVTLVWLMVRGSPRRALMATAAVLPLALGLLLAFSRGAWIATAAAVALLAWISLVTSRRTADRKRLIIITGGGGVALALAVVGALQLDSVRSLMTERASLDQSYDNGPEGRFGGQAKARRLVLENPLGIGTHAFREVHHAEEPHNVYLTTFLNAGWIGGLAYVAMTLVTLALGLRGAMRNGVLQGPFAVATAAFAGIAIEGLVIDSDHWRHYFLLLALVWGLSDATTPAATRDARADDEDSQGL